MNARIDELLIKFREDSITADELRTLCSFVDGSDDEELAGLLAEDWASFEASFQSAPARRRMAWTKIAAVAAAVLLPVFIVSTVYFYRQSHGMDNAVVSFSSASMQNYKMVLPDGSKVTMGYASELSYEPSDFMHGQRRISFSGEGYFEVKSDAGHPFVVDAKGFDVVVKGTSFNLYCGNDSVAELSLESGVVQLEFPDGGRTDMRPGEKAEIDCRAGTAKVSHCDDIDAVSAWQRGEIILRDASVGDVADAFGRYYGVNITIEGEGIDDTVTFTGTLPTASIQEAMNIIGLAFDADVSVRP